MKITLLYGCRKNGSTARCVHLAKKYLEDAGKVEFTEVHLREELPDLCRGCFNCILRDEKTCPHAAVVQPILNKILEADGLILASPVYGMDVSGAMKNLIDHLCYLWMPHRPLPAMFTKKAWVISTAAGSGTGRTNKTMKQSLCFWGVGRIQEFGASIAASSWEDISEKKRLSMEKRLEKGARRFYQRLSKSSEPALGTRFLFNIMKRMISGYDHSNIDWQYWEAMGWLTR